MKRLHIPWPTINWIIYFVTDRTQLVVINGNQLLMLLITRSIVHVQVCGQPVPGMSTTQFCYPEGRICAYPGMGSTEQAQY